MININNKRVLNKMVLFYFYLPSTKLFDILKLLIILNLELYNENVNCTFKMGILNFNANCIIYENVLIS